MWITRWNEIAARIESMKQSTHLYFESFQATNCDYHSISSHYLIPEAREIFERIKSFKENFGDILSPGASTAIEKFIVTSKTTFENALGINGVAAVSISLASIKGNLEYHLKTVDSYGKSVTERAFEHLQRSIVVDEDFRSRWIKAFASGETACEKLGAIHLLLHGIWGFKIDAKGERTDLVFGEPIALGSAERTVPAAIVLTEWKVASSSDKAQIQFQVARDQTKLYSHGSLSDLELSGTRFLIMVTEKRIDPPADFTDGNIQYRHLNIVVNPDAPSISAKRH